MAVSTTRPTRRIRTKASRNKERKAKRQQEIDELVSLRARLKDAKFTNYTKELGSTKFSQLPISSKTVRGLTEAHYVEMTQVQRETIPFALAGKDILGAAKTGSGKTLGFLIPVVEYLYREGWSLEDGLGALILAPTRELAVQIFEVLRKVGQHHALSAGLVIGGKSLKEEQEAISRMNLLVATPGRLLQHLDQTVGFTCDNLQILVLDEADRILDLGFAATINAILAALPKSRQTLLFSATQTDSVNSLARLSLKDPIKISVDAGDNQATPSQLRQYYMVVGLEEKLDYLFGFLRANSNSKILVFLASCKQVRFVYESFCRLQPGLSLSSLHGRQKQSTRLAVVKEFCKKRAAALFATDLAARGLDIPAVDWVIQIDCPDDIETYIHRVGRTARYESAGNALLMMLSSEQSGMLSLLSNKNIPIESMHPLDKPIPPPKFRIAAQLQALCSQDPEIKYLAQKALVSYVRSVFLQANKDIFRVHDLPLPKFAEALGLFSVPKLRFIGRSNAKNVSRQQQLAISQLSDSEDEEGGLTVSSNKSADGNMQVPTTTTTHKKPTTKIDRMFSRKNQNVLSEHYAKLRNDHFGDSDKDQDEPSTIASQDNDSLFVLKRADHDIETNLPSKCNQDQQACRDRLKTKKRYKLKSDERRTKYLFDENGVPREAFPFIPEASFNQTKAAEDTEQFIAKERKLLEQSDFIDQARQKEQRRLKRLEKKRKLNQPTSSNSTAPQLLSPDHEQ